MKLTNQEITLLAGMLTRVAPASEEEDLLKRYIQANAGYSVWIDPSLTARLLIDRNPDIQEGDVVEVFQATCKRWTADSDIGLIGRVCRVKLHDTVWTVTIDTIDQETVALCDVRRV